MTDADPEIRELSMETLEKAIAEAGAAAEEKVRIRLHVIEQEPAQALIEAAKGADLLVVGSRRHGGLTSILLGSVSQRCVHHAPCPVVVVHSHEG
jgi:nucleotide-binding universal stress UspA family protein